jgi:hypothetical protein
LERRQIEPYVATGREPHHQSWQARFAGEPEPPPADVNPQIKMAYRLRTAVGKAIYRLRKCSVEPVIGIIKSNAEQYLESGVLTSAGSRGIVILHKCVCTNVRFLLLNTLSYPFPRGMGNSE